MHAGGNMLDFKVEFSRYALGKSLTHQIYAAIWKYKNNLPPNYFKPTKITICIGREEYLLIELWANIEHREGKSVPVTFSHPNGGKVLTIFNCLIRTSPTVASGMGFIDHTNNETRTIYKTEVQL